MGGNLPPSVLIIAFSQLYDCIQGEASTSKTTNQ